MTVDNILDFYRRTMTHIFEGGNIFETKNVGRRKAYEIIAKLASELRRDIGKGK